MKISIVTVYESMNCGAYLQAWALRKFLENQENEVSYLKNNSRNSLKIVLKKSIKLFLKGRIHDFKMIWRTYLIFRSYHKEFNLCKRDSQSLNEQDLFILGSDEIWNVSKKDMAPFPLFWGIGLPEKPIISYAPSVNNATEKDIGVYPYSKEALAKIRAISVRDTHTKKIIEQFTDKPVTLVCDPTMLFSQDDYSKFIERIEDKNYILIYDCYKSFSAIEIEKCKKFAHENKKKLISFGAYLPWCDKSLPADPINYLAYFKNADFIFTGTFHGTIYSMIFNKQFVSMGKIGMKVIRTLEFYGLENRMLKEDNLENLTKQSIDYNEVNKKIEKVRRTSIEFLNDSILLAID